MRKLILASHGELAIGMLNSVSMIAGDIVKNIETYCLYPGQTPSDYMHEMKTVIEKNQQVEFVFLCDIKGGSVHTALSQLCVFSNVKVFSGMNMNLVLDLVLSYPDVLDEKKEETLLDHAKEGITVIAKSRLVVEEDDEF